MGFIDPIFDIVIAIVTHNGAITQGKEKRVSVPIQAVMKKQILSIAPSIKDEKMLCLTTSQYTAIIHLSKES